MLLLPKILLLLFFFADDADTTRLIRPGEVNSHDYHFVSREEFERDVEQDRFLEYGEFKGHFYGTAFSSIKRIMESGRVPVLDLHPQVGVAVRLQYHYCATVVNDELYTTYVCSVLSSILCRDRPRDVFCNLG